MSPLVWIAASGAAGGLLLYASKSKASSTPTPPTPAPTPLQTYGESERVILAVPAGWRRVTGAEVSALPELRVQASALQNTSGFKTMQYGTLTPFVASDGNTYATWIEQHYHPPEGPVKPWGYHHGVTLLARVEAGTVSGIFLGGKPVSGFALGDNRSWFIWWIDRDWSSYWFGPRYLSDEELWQFESDVERGTPGVRRLYRWVWDGSAWQYDTRSAVSLYVRAGEQRYSSYD
jgi:hypothetical protein